MSWDLILFENIYKIPSKNGLYKSSKFEGRGIPIVKMKQQYSQGFINALNSEFDLIELTKSELEKNEILVEDLLFSRTSVVAEGVGKCSIIKFLSTRTIFDSNIIRIRMDSNKANSLFYYYYFKSFMGRGVILSLSNGVNIKTIKSSDLKKIQAPYPPLKTQKRIADILSAYDDLIENNLKRIKLLEQAAQNIYKEWFVNLRFPGYEDTPIIEETGLPEGWEENMLKDLCHLTMGQSPKSEYYNLDNEGLPFHQGVTGYGNRFVKHSTYCTKITRIAEEGDILCSVRAPVGRLNISPSKLIIGRGLSAIRNKNGFQSFQFCQLKNHFYQEDMIGGGAIFNSVTKKVLEEQKLLSPNIELQEEFEKIVIPIDDQIVNLDEQNQKLKAARDILLPRLMNRTIEV
ncbi:MAG: type I restriction enzyme S subunit [Flavobacteriales bacterium]|jgi:type I restriction enzyme S subunit